MQMQPIQLKTSALSAILKNEQRIARKIARLTLSPSSRVDADIREVYRGETARRGKARVKKFMVYR
jgi:hypothetical protein